MKTPEVLKNFYKLAKEPNENVTWLSNNKLLVNNNETFRKGHFFDFFGHEAVGNVIRTLQNDYGFKVTKEIVVGWNKELPFHHRIEMEHEFFNRNDPSLLQKFERSQRKKNESEELFSLASAASEELEDIRRPRRTRETRETEKTDEELIAEKNMLLATVEEAEKVAEKKKLNDAVRKAREKLELEIVELRKRAKILGIKP